MITTTQDPSDDEPLTVAHFTRAVQRMREVVAVEERRAGEFLGYGGPNGELRLLPSPYWPTERRGDWIRPLPPAQWYWFIKLKHLRRSPWARTPMIVDADPVIVDGTIHCSHAQADHIKRMLLSA